MNENLIIKATPNYSKRTFTIREYVDGKVFIKWRTYDLNKNEFDSMLDFTQHDWVNWLQHIEAYYEVK